MSVKADQIVHVFIFICIVFGGLLGFVGLGIGLVLFSVRPAIGIGMLSFGLGSLFGLVFGGKRIMRAVIETLRDMDSRKA